MSRERRKMQSTARATPPPRHLDTHGNHGHAGNSGNVPPASGVAAKGRLHEGLPRFPRHERVARRGVVCRGRGELPGKAPHFLGGNLRANVWPDLPRGRPNAPSHWPSRRKARPMGRARIGSVCPADPRRGDLRYTECHGEPGTGYLNTIQF